MDALVALMELDGGAVRIPAEAGVPAGAMVVVAAASPGSDSEAEELLALLTSDSRGHAASTNGLALCRHTRDRRV